MFMLIIEVKIILEDMIVVTLTLGLWPRLGHEKGNEFGEKLNCHVIQTHFHKFETCKEASFNTPNEFSFGSWKSHGVLNLWTKLNIFKKNWKAMKSR
jgi:hypothetical protein